MRRLALLLACGATVCGCGGSQDQAPPPPPRLPQAVPIGRSPEHRPPALSARTRAALPVGRLRCSRAEPPRFGVHVEVFVRRQTVIVPAGIGVAPPWRGRPPYVRSGRCSYPLRTREPTGVVEVADGERATLGDLFSLWGRPLRPRYVWVDGRRRSGDPRAVPLERHAQIVVSEDARVPVHASYVFPPGL
jgi:hypothetical protein